MVRSGKKQNKRKVSPESLNRVSDRFLDEEEQEQKRVKTEPAPSPRVDPSGTEETQQSSAHSSHASAQQERNADSFPREGGAAAAAENVRPSGRRATVGAKARVGRASSQVVRATTDAELVNETVVIDEPPPDFLHILSRASTSDKVTHALIDDLLDRAFRTPTIHAGEAPASRYVERSMEGILINRPSDEQLTKLNRIFHEAWLQRMALHTGGHIKSSQQLGDVLKTIATSLPFELPHSDPLNGFLNNITDISAPTSQGRDVIRKALLRDHAHCRLSDPPQSPASSSAHQTLPQTPESRRTESRDSMTAQLDSCRKAGTLPHRRDTGPEVKDHETKPSETPKAESVQELKGRFPHTFDVFLHHINEYRLGMATWAPRSVLDSDDIKQRAKVIYKSLDTDAKKLWRNVRKCTNQGDLTTLDPAVPQDLLAQQGIVEQLGLDQKDAVADFYPQFIRVPSLPTREFTTNCRLMFVARDTEGRKLDISAAALKEACNLALNPALPSPIIEQWSDDIFVAKFDSVSSANRARGAVVSINRLQLTAEHLHAPARPPVQFICSIFDISISKEEIGLRVAQAFPEHVQFMTVHVQHSPKLYAGTHIWASFRHAPRLVRFYLPVQQEYSDDVFVACFKPWNPKAKCPFCRDHDMQSPSDCEHAKPISLSKLE